MSQVSHTLFIFLICPPPPTPTLFPYTTLFRSRYTLHSRIVQGGRTIKEFTSRTFRATDLKEGRIEFTEKWMPDRLWDIQDRKSTRLNSSHANISYAVFCLKKKTN